MVTGGGVVGGGADPPHAASARAARDDASTGSERGAFGMACGISQKGPGRQASPGPRLPPVLKSGAPGTYRTGPVRRILIALAACAAPAAVTAVVACSGGKASPAAQPDAADATSSGDDAVSAADTSTADAADELSQGDVCGQPPYVTLGIVVVALTLDNPDGAPLPGAKFTSPLCPGLVQYSDDAGVIQGQVSKDTPFYGRLEANGFIPELAPEEIFDADSTGHAIQMIPQIIEGFLLPAFDASASTAVVVAVQKTTDDAGACSSYDGVTVTVPGHPEAVVTYFTSDTIPVPVPDGGATTTRGLAAITGLAPGQLVTLAGTKPGCNVLFQYDTLTGRVPLETGFISLMPAYVTP